MQAQEEFTRSNDPRRRALIMKGKRTKRQRSSSPFGVTVTSSSSSGGGMEEYYSTSSPTTTSGEIYERTEEEEEMANCLIMLAQSDGPSRRVEAKFDTATATDKAGIYDYECKTCDRSFPSFQALGGHMASHKKPKSSISEHKESLASAVNNDAVIAFRSVRNRKGSNKIHECSICGSRYLSGQALGGHMRRHRVAATASNESPLVNVDTISSIDSSKLLLDLNLPAPDDDDDDDDHRDSQFGFGEVPQQAIVLSSTPALVDCHY